MGPEFWVGLAAVFVSGGALGAGGALLTQWMIRKVDNEPDRSLKSADPRATELLRAEGAAGSTRGGLAPLLAVQLLREGEEFENLEAPLPYGKLDHHLLVLARAEESLSDGRRQRHMVTVEAHVVAGHNGQRKPLVQNEILDLDF